MKCRNYYKIYSNTIPAGFSKIVILFCVKAFRKSFYMQTFYIYIQVKFFHTLSQIKTTANSLQMNSFLDNWIALRLSIFLPCVERQSVRYICRNVALLVLLWVTNWFTFTNVSNVSIITTYSLSSIINHYFCFLPHVCDILQR